MDALLKSFEEVVETSAKFSRTDRRLLEPEVEEVFTFLEAQRHVLQVLASKTDAGVGRLNDYGCYPKLGLPEKVGKRYELLPEGLE